MNPRDGAPTAVLQRSGSRVRQRVQDYLQAPRDAGSRRKALNALLHTLFVYSPSAATFLAGAGVELDRLRQDHETLPAG